MLMLHCDSVHGGRTYHVSRPAHMGRHADLHTSPVSASAAWHLAVTPCPAPPPPSLNVPDCPAPVPVFNASVGPACYGGSCQVFGPQKAYDNISRGWQSLAIVQYGTNPYLQLDFNETRTDIMAVVITARGDCCLDQSQNLNVYLGTNSTFLDPSSGLPSTGTAACVLGVHFTALGQTATVLCPTSPTTGTGTPAQFLTVMLNGTNNLAVQEITALYNGER